MLEEFVIIWDPMNGIAMADGKILNWASEVARAASDGTLTSICVGSEILVDALRAKMANGDFRVQMVSIKRVQGDGHSYIDPNSARYEDYLDVFQLNDQASNVGDRILMRLI